MVVLIELCVLGFCRMCSPLRISNLRMIGVEWLGKYFRTHLMNVNQICGCLSCHKRCISIILVLCGPMVYTQ